MIHTFFKIQLFIFTVFIFNTIISQEVKQIEIIQSQSIEFDEKIGEGVKRILGNVVFRHEGIYMFCDSAYYYDNNNTATAFGNVRIKQGDSILFVSKYLEYEGNTKYAKMRDSVVLKHNQSYLLTDSLDYDRNEDIAYYFGGGRIFDSDNRLTSKRGYYYTVFKDYYAVDSVILKNPQYYIDSDTMKYNTDLEISYFYGRTNIVSDSNFLYCENGYYDTKYDVASLSKNSWIRSGQNYLYADSIYYDRNIRYGEGFNNVSMIDTVENVIVKGDYGYYYEDPQNALLTKRAQVIFVNDNDSIFMHSDTILIDVDTADIKLIRAFRKVQIYKTDIQGRCDSLTFHSLDSIVHMYYAPILWAEGNKQVTADHISLYIENNEPKTFYLNNNAFAIERLDSLHYSQAKSDNIDGHIKDNELYLINMHANSQTIYYLVDEEINEIVGYNKLSCVDISVSLKDNQIEEIWVYEEPDGNLIPIEQVISDQLFLDDFRWLDQYRPKTKEDIFIWHEINSKIE